MLLRGAAAPGQGRVVLPSIEAGGNLAMISVPPSSTGDRGSDPVAGAGSDLVHRAREGGELVELIRRSARGHEDAFATLYDKTSARIYGIVLRVLRSPDQAAEVTQEVYVEVWRQAARYSPEKGGVLAWMATMAHRRAIDRVRSVSSETARDQRYALREAEPAHDHVWSGVEQRLDVERVRRGLAALTGIQREAILLAYFGGYSQSQVAALLELPLGTVKTRIRDGLIRLRDALGVER
jgi:RNA polymerase sigma-70 factor, ECF subfamily